MYLPCISQVVAAGLNQIAHQEPLPALMMRTVMNSIKHHPPLVEKFIMDLLRHLISRKVWTDKLLWAGFVRCCGMGAPHSSSVVLSLPKAQMLAALEQQPELRPPCIAYAASHIGEMTAEVLDALGLAEEEATLNL